MHYSKVVLTLMFLALGAFNIVSQNTISINGIKANGEKVAKNDVFLLNDACTFYVQNENGEKQELQSSKWQLLCKDKNGNDVVEREIKEQNEFHFLLDDFRAETSELRQVKSDTDRSVYFEAYIKCFGTLKDGNSFEILFPIYFNLLPSISTGDILSHHREGFYTYVDIDCKSERSNESDLIFNEYQAPHKWTTIIPLETSIYHDLTLDSQLDAIEFGIVNKNKYGAVFTGYILVPYSLYAGIDNVNSDNSISFYPNPFQNEINISGDINQVKTLCIYDINGRLIKQISKPQSNVIPTEDLSAGVYIVNVELINNLGCNKYKLIKK